MVRLWNAGLMLLRRVAAAVRRSRLDDELDEEIRQHIELRRQQLIDDGMGPREALFEARRMFGNVTARREEAWDMWGFPSLDTVLQDVRYGTRLLRRSPVFTVVAVLSLAIAIGAAVAVFSLADAMLFRKLPVASPDDLVILRWRSGLRRPAPSLSGNSGRTETENFSTSFSLATFDAMQREMGAVADVFGFAGLYGGVTLTIDGQSEVGSGQVVSGNYFATLGIRPAAGRFLAVSDDRPDATPVTVLSHVFWMRRFGGTPDTVGRTIMVNGAAFTVVGVAPQGFHGTLQVGESPVVTLPMALRSVIEGEERRPRPTSWWVLMMARLKPGVTVGGARAQFDTILKRSVAQGDPSIAASDLPRMELLPGARGQHESREGMVDPLFIMTVVVGIVLLVACANVANLLLVRGAARLREIAVRAAIGAPRARIVRQLLTEGLLLALLGSALGLVVAQWIASGLLPALGGSDLAVFDVRVDWRAFGFTAALAAVCSVMFGLTPSLRATDIKLASNLQEHMRGTAAAPRRFSLTGALVVVQVALSVLLVTAAGLLFYSVRNLLRVDPGFDATNTLLFRIDPTRSGYQSQRIRELYSAAQERLTSLPGARSVSFSSMTLISGGASQTIAAPLDAPALQPNTDEYRRFAAQNGVWRLVVDDRFFDTMGIPILRGRSLSRADSIDAQRAAVVNRALATQLFGDVDVVGRRFKLGVTPDVPVFEIVGVSADAKYSSMRRDPPPTMYASYRQDQRVGAMTFEIKSADNPLALVPLVREAMRGMDSSLPLSDIRTQEEQIRYSLRRERLLANLATMLGAVALVLSGIGLYGVLAYSVSRRIPEIGIRMALGAEQHTVRWMIMRNALALAIAGVALGLPAALAGTRIVQSLLFGLTATDPLTFAVAIAIMLAVAIVAAYVPARRASRIDPIVALRTE